MKPGNIIFPERLAGIESLFVSIPICIHALFFTCATSVNWPLNCVMLVTVKLLLALFTFSGEFAVCSAPAKNTVQV